MIPFVIGVRAIGRLDDSDREALELVTSRIVREVKNRLPGMPVIVLSPLTNEAEKACARVAQSEGANLVALGVEPADLNACADVVDLNASDNACFSARQQGRLLTEEQRAGAFLSQRSHLILAFQGREDPDAGKPLAGLVRLKLETLLRAIDRAGDPLGLSEHGPVYVMLTKGAHSDLGMRIPDFLHPVFLDRLPDPVVSNDPLFDVLSFLTRFHHDASVTVEISPSDLLTPDERARLDPGCQSILDVFEMADALSIHYREQTKQALITLLLLALLGSCAFQAT